MAVDRFDIAGPLLRALAPERAHALTLWALRRGLAGPGAPDDPILETRLWDRVIPNPLGIAAGFDKNAEVIGPLFDMGFGCVEVGTVTPRPQPGNPPPRVFRLPADGALINRLGFNSAGAEAVARRLAAWRATGQGGLLGVNLGKNRDSTDAAHDYAAGAALLGGYADYLAINVSSPNTPGLRALQGREELLGLIAAVRAALPAGAKPRLLVKLAPDLSEADLADVAAVALEAPLDGLIATNTTTARPPGLADPQRSQAGGLSGRPLFTPSTAVLARLHALTQGRVVLIGVGGVASGADAYAKLRAGASLVQLYTALTYSGPGLLAAIKRDLAVLLRHDGFASPAAAVGTAAEGATLR